MNLIFVLLIVVSFIAGAVTHSMPALTLAMTDAAGQAVTLAIGLVGVLGLFLGVMKIAEAAGLLTQVARLLAPLMRRLFPEVPPDHPAMGAMVMNLSANLLGLGNAATPFGVKAMQELDRLNPDKGVASDAMVLFLALNTAGLSLVPAKVIALRATAHSADPAAILPTTLAASLVATVAAVLAAKLLGRRRHAAVTGNPAPAARDGEAPVWGSLLAFAALVAVVPVMILYGRTLSPWILPTLLAGMVAYGAARRVPVYETFVEGAREGFQVAVRIMPYLIAILVAVGLVKASGAMAMVMTPLGRLTTPLGLPPEALTLAVMRTLSGSGSFGLLAADLNDPAIGPDSYLGHLLSTLYGSTETTFYVLAVYFGAVQIRRIRHALAAGLIADAAAAVTAVVVCSWVG